jgi:DNA-binding NarL/FixJ family response regulator
VLGLAASGEECEALVRGASAPEIVLLDAGLPNGRELAGLLSGGLDRVQIVVFSMHETEDEVIAWAEAGVSAYLPKATPLTDVVHLLHRIRRGEQPCASHVAGGLLRRIAAGNRRPPPPPDAPLTSREREVAQFVVVGLSNKEIARQLQLGVPTVKSHVHNMLGKLKLSRRSQLAYRLREAATVHAPTPPPSLR